MKVKQHWSIKLGLIQAVVLLGIVTGSMLCAFYLGLISGQKAGFESAQAINLASVAKLPIPEQYRNAELDEVASKVYAKLSNPNPHNLVLEEEEESRAVDLTPIKEKKVVKPSELTVAAIDKAEQKSKDHEKVIRILSEPPSGKLHDSQQINDTETIGSLKNAAQKEEKNVIETPPENTHAKTSVLDSLKDEELVEDTIGLDGASVDEPALPAKNNIEVVKGYRDEEEVKEPKKITEPTVIAKVDHKKEVEPNKIEKPEKHEGLVLHSGWYVQVASAAKMNDASSLVNKLKESGFPAVVEEASIRGSSYFRVLVGPDEEKRYSETMVQQLKRESYIKGDPFIRRVK